MADINVERKRRGILPLLLGLLALLALAWLLFSLLNRGDGDDADAGAGTDTVTVAPAPAGAVDPAAAGTAGAATGAAAGAAGAPAGDALPVAQIVGGRMAGQTVSGSAVVTAVVSDHGFWVEEGGQRVFVAMGEPQAGEQSTQVRTGQTVTLTGAAVHGEGDLPQGIDPEARGIAQSQPAFLFVPRQGVQVQGGA